MASCAKSLHIEMVWWYSFENVFWETTGNTKCCAMSEKPIQAQSCNSQSVIFMFVHLCISWTVVFRHELVKTSHHLRSSRQSSTNQRVFQHLDIVNVQPSLLACFKPIELEMTSRLDENRLTQHSIVKKVPGISTGFFEIKHHFNQEIKDFVVSVLSSTSRFDKATKVSLTRGLMNYYSTDHISGSFSSHETTPW